MVVAYVPPTKLIAELMAVIPKIKRGKDVAVSADATEMAALPGYADCK